MVYVVHLHHLRMAKSSAPRVLQRIDRVAHMATSDHMSLQLRLKSFHIFIALRFCIQKFLLLLFNSIAQNMVEKPRNKGWLNSNNLLWNSQGFFFLLLLSKFVIELNPLCVLTLGNNTKSSVWQLFRRSWWIWWTNSEATHTSRWCITFGHGLSTKWIITSHLICSSGNNPVFMEKHKQTNIKWMENRFCCRKWKQTA